MSIKFTQDKTEMAIIDKIAARAVKMAIAAGIYDYDELSAAMDISACHSNGCPLQLEELLNAGDFDFAHDIYGIRRHLNRETGQLGDFFDPRYSA